jgi:hypothetical protein
MAVPADMTKLTLSFLLLCTLSLGIFSCPARGADLPGVTQITGCKPGTSVSGSKGSGITIRSYARFSCGSSVYVWNVTSNSALVQQGMIVAYVRAKYVLGIGAEKGSSPSATRAFLQTVAEELNSSNASAISLRREIVQRCLGIRGCRAEMWSHVAWTRLKQPNEILDSPDATVRLFADGRYYALLVVKPPVRFRDRALPGFDSPVLILDGGGVSIAVANQTCYTLGTNGKWSAAGANAVESAAAIR